MTAQIAKSARKNTLFESVLMEHDIYRDARRAAQIINELKMPEEQILKLFTNVEQAMTAAGGNRTLLGKGKDAATAVANAFAKVRDRKSTRLNSSHIPLSRMPSSA